MPVISTVPTNDISQDYMTQARQAIARSQATPPGGAAHAQAVVNNALTAGATPEQLQWAKDNWSGGVVGWCEQFVENALRSTGAAVQRFPSAIAAANAQKDKLSTDFANIQPGDPLYYGPASDNAGYGHAALYAGKDANGTDLVQSAASPTPTPMHGYFGGQLLGYVPHMPDGGPFAAAAVAARAHGLDPGLFVSQMRAENSSGNPDAVSSAGAIGPAQLMPATARGLGLSIKDAMDPAKAYDAAARYMAQLKDRFGGDIQSAIQAYNAGPNGDFNNPETQNYLQKVLAGATQAPQPSPPPDQQQQQPGITSPLPPLPFTPPGAGPAGTRPPPEFPGFGDNDYSPEGFQAKIAQILGSMPRSPLEAAGAAAGGLASAVRGLSGGPPPPTSPQLGPSLDPDLAPPPSIQYNEQTPSGDFQRVTNFGGGNYTAVPTAMPSPDAVANYAAQNALTSGFTAPDIAPPTAGPALPLYAQQTPSFPSPTGPPDLSSPAAAQAPPPPAPPPATAPPPPPSVPTLPTLPIGQLNPPAGPSMPDLSGSPIAQAVRGASSAVGGGLSALRQNLPDLSLPQVSMPTVTAPTLSVPPLPTGAGAGLAALPGPVAAPMGGPAPPPGGGGGRQPDQAPPAGQVEAGTLDPSAGANGALAIQDSDGKIVVIPASGPDGSPMTVGEAMDAYYRSGQHLGKFASRGAAEAYIQQVRGAPPSGQPGPASDNAGSGLTFGSNVPADEGPLAGLGDALDRLKATFPATAEQLGKVGQIDPSSPQAAAQSLLDRASGFGAFKNLTGTLGGLGVDLKNLGARTFTGDTNATYDTSGLGQAGTVNLPVVGSVPLIGGAIGQILDLNNLIPGGKAERVAEGAAAKVGEKLAPEAAKVAEEVAPKVERTAEQIIDDVIQASNIPGKKPSVAERLSGVPSDAEVKWADRFAALTKTPEGSQAVSAIYGRDAAVDADVEDLLKPILDALPTKTDKQAYNGYINLERYIETAGVKGNPDRLGLGGSVSNVEQAKVALANYPSKVGADVWNKIQQAEQARLAGVDAVRNEVVRTEFKTPEQMADLAASQPHYNPNYIVEHVNSIENQGGGAGGSLSQNSNTFKDLTKNGTASDQLPPLLSLARGWRDTLRAVRNHDAVSTLARTLDLPVEKASTVLHGGFAPGDINGYVSLWKNGERYLAKVNPAEEQALKNLTTEQIQDWERKAQMLNHAAREGMTSINPGFGLGTNLARDAAVAYVREGLVGRGFLRMIPTAETLRLEREFVRQGGTIGRSRSRGLTPQLSDEAFQKKVEESGSGAVIPRNAADLARIARALVRPDPSRVISSGLGGTFGFASAPSPDEGRSDPTLQDRLQNAAKLAGIGYLAPSIIRPIAERIEMGPRLATFEKHLKAGDTPAAAMEAGRRVTTDFDRAGSTAKTLNMFSLFLNARTQGILGVGRTLRDIPASRARLGSLAAAAVAAAAHNYSLDPERMADIPNYEKEGGVVILNPNEPAVRNANGIGFKTNPHWTIPLGEYGAILPGINALVSKAFGQNPDLAQTVAQSVNALNPVPGADVGLDPTSLQNFGGSAVANLLPAPLKELEQQTANYDYFRQGQIVPDAMKNVPINEQYGATTSDVSKQIGKTLNISPLRVEHFISGNLGGGGRELAQAADTLAGRPATTPPVLGGLLSGIVRTTGGQLATDAYGRLDAGLAQDQRDNADIYDKFAQNGDLIQPPQGSLTYLGHIIPIRPDEELAYQQARIAVLRQFLDSYPDVNRYLDPSVPVAARRQVLQRLMAGADQVATGTILTGLGAEEIRARVLQNLAAPPKPYQVPGPPLVSAPALQ